MTLQVVPLPGVGAIIAGIKNPHTPLLKHGIAQLTLIFFGSWPLIVPGAAGLIWAIVDAVAIANHAVNPAAWSAPRADAAPETLDVRREAKQASRDAKRTKKAAHQADKAAEKQAADRARRTGEE